MAKKLKPNDTINGYQIQRHITTGMMAFSFEARSKDGQRVFLKQYRSPSVLVEWYKGYVQYQAELKRRIESGRVKHYCYRMIDFFEAEWGHRCYFQVFEFVERGHDLEVILEKMRSNPRSLPMDRRLILAKVFMAGLSALHEAHIVHCDLKPPNIQLFEDKTIGAGYQLKLIDMDYSVLADRRAPWHGFQNYVGSPHYFSPEHLAGACPCEASDVFTGGLILYELLTGQHPYNFEDDSEYSRAVTTHRAAAPKLAADIPGAAQIAEVLHCCLAPNPAERPTAKEVNECLRGSSAPVSRPKPSKPGPGPKPEEPGPAGEKDRPASEPRRPPEETPPRKSEPAGAGRLSLVGAEEKSVCIGIRTSIGKHLMRQLGEDAKFWDTAQFTLEPKDGQWTLVPNPAAPNETLLNGKAVTAPAPVHDGDVLAVGREAKAISKLPVTVRITA